MDPPVVVVMWSCDWLVLHWFPFVDHSCLCGFQLLENLVKTLLVPCPDPSGLFCWSLVPVPQFSDASPVTGGPCN